MDSIHSMVDRLRSSENSVTREENEEVKYMLKMIAKGLKSGEIAFDQVRNLVSNVHEIEEMSATGGGVAPGQGASFTPGTGMAYAQALDKPKKKIKKEAKDKEPKLAAGKLKKNYAVDKFGFTPAPSIPNRPSTGGFQYKELWSESYSSFKKEARERDAVGQFNRGIGIVRKKLSECYTMMEYLSQMRDDMTVAGQLKESKQTKKALDKMTHQIKELYHKHKTLK